jgi:transcriptional regulator with XRE-family HTH domain
LAAVQSPTVRRRRLGHELRRLREDAALTLDEVAERLDMSAAKISRIETGRVGVRPRDVTDLLDVYGVEDQQRRANLLTLTREARQRGWWYSFSETTEHQDLATLVGLETEASALRTYDVQIVHGLLQTEDYARAVLRAAWRADAQERIERRVEFRMARQQLLTGDDPPQLWTILDEAVLHRSVGGPKVMLGQLNRLVGLADSPNITLQVLPFAAGAHVGIDGQFSMVELHEDPPMVVVEYRTGLVILERQEDVRTYDQVFDRLRATALSPDESAVLMSRLAGEF